MYFIIKGLECISRLSVYTYECWISSEKCDDAGREERRVDSEQRDGLWEPRCNSVFLTSWVIPETVEISRFYFIAWKLSFFLKIACGSFMFRMQLIIGMLL